MPKSLSHLIDQIPPTNPETVPDSCDEDSSDDEEVQPKPLGGARAVGGGRSYGGLPSSSRTPNGVRGSVTLRTPVREGESRVEATVGRGGKLVYHTVKTGLPAWYYNVQW
jgi:hypothetical protein